MPRPVSSRPLGLVEKVGYGLGDAACNVVFQLVLTFLPFFYTDVLGIEAAAMGTLMLVVRAATALADPLAGALCDRTYTRWGKFRPYLLWLAIPFAVAAVATFTAPDLAPRNKLIYAYVTYSLLMILYSGVNVPYCALGAVITTDSRQRISLNGYRFLLATAGGTLVAATTLPLVRMLGRGNAALGFPLAVAVLSAVAIGLLAACYAMTQERVVERPVDSRRLWNDLKLLFRNDQWWIVAAINFVLFVALVIQDGAAVYYVRWYMAAPDLTGPFVTTGLVSSMAGAVCAGPLLGRMSKARAYALLQAVIVLVSGIMYFVAAGQLAWLFALYAVQQFFTQMASPVLWSMMADTTDYGEYISGHRITGLTFSGALLALKVGAAVGGALLGWLLATFGYDGRASIQSAATIHGIVLIFTLLPAMGHLLLIGLVSRYRLDTAMCDTIRDALHRRSDAP